MVCLERFPAIKPSPPGQPGTRSTGLWCDLHVTGLGRQVVVTFTNVLSSIRLCYVPRILPCTAVLRYLGVSVV